MQSQHLPITSSCSKRAPARVLRPLHRKSLRLRQASFHPIADAGPGSTSSLPPRSQRRRNMPPQSLHKTKRIGKQFVASFSERNRRTESPTQRTRQHEHTFAATYEGYSDRSQCRTDRSLSSQHMRSSRSTVRYLPPAARKGTDRDTSRAPWRSTGYKSISACHFPCLSLLVVDAATAPDRITPM